MLSEQVKEKNQFSSALKSLDRMRKCCCAAFDMQQPSVQREMLSKTSNHFELLVLIVPLPSWRKLITKQIRQTQEQLWDKPLEERLQNSSISGIRTCQKKPKCSEMMVQTSNRIIKKHLLRGCFQ